ncbi:MAG TPA: bifunctional hexulose-6-phosphate synthase/ribonuclease regulator [Euryarchaeota archaeon]|nr:bifunctional hexulose-6-phosphate synthase/ribonuclease regulator [Euryarchaeota archaeon]
MRALQVALDVMSVEDALTVAEEAVAGGVNWLEVGTPLIKNHGMVAVKKLRAAFPKSVLVADLKTMDAGDIEVEMAAKNGADVVVVLGVAPDLTFKRALNQAAAHNIKIMADLIGVDNPVGRAKELEALGVDYLLVHTPLDVQRVMLEAVDSGLDGLKEIVGAVDIPVAAAGGITLETAPVLLTAGVSIFIVGRALTKAKDVTGTASRLCEIIGVETKIEKRAEPSIDEIIAGFESLPTPFISDAMKRFGAMRGLHPVVKGKRVAGPAYTVKTLGGDWGKVVKAVDLASPGDVIVVDAQGMDVAVWGELATLSAIKRGVKAVVIDGGIRDADDILELGFPLWSRTVTPNAGEPHGHGRLQELIACAGQPVSPGDIVVADEVGVVVVPREQAYEILRKAMEVSAKEKRYKKGIAEGKTLSEIFGL